MFALRGIAVSSSVLVIVYCTLSLAICFFWSAVHRRLEKRSVHRIADWLFALRMLPLATAAAMTVIFAAPSFLLLEPRAVDEPIGEIPVVLAIIGAVLAIAGFINAGIALRKASRAISSWTRNSSIINTTANLPTLRISRAIPAMTVIGIARPRILLSKVAESMLTAGELQTALKHETAHVRRRDNLKKLLFRLMPFPGMSRLENAWLEATEMAADDAAVSNASEALDLASALIRLSQLAPIEPSVDLTAALVHNPVSAMNARIERLLAWTEASHLPSRKYYLWPTLAAAAATIVVFTICYGSLLVRVHTATEWLVR